MMRKVICLMLALLILCVAGTAFAADRVMASGIIRSIDENGNLHCEEFHGPTFTALITEDTDIQLNAEPAVNMLISVTFAAPQNVDNLLHYEVTAAKIIPLSFLAWGLSADPAEPNALDISTIWYSDTNLYLPEDTDLEYLIGNDIWVTPTTIEGMTFRQALKAEEVEILQDTNGDITEVGEGFLTISRGNAGDMRVVITADTYCPSVLAVGDNIIVAYNTVDESGEVPEVTAVHINISHG